MNKPRIPALLFALVLAGCRNGPSAADIDAKWAHKFAIVQAQLTQFQMQDDPAYAAAVAPYPSSYAVHTYGSAKEAYGSALYDIPFVAEAIAKHIGGEVCVDHGGLAMEWIDGNDRTGYTCMDKTTVLMGQLPAKDRAELKRDEQDFENHLTGDGYKP